MFYIKESENKKNSLFLMKVLLDKSLA